MIMDAEFELLDLPSNLPQAKQVHDQGFDSKKDSFFIGWSWISSWVNIFCQVMQKKGVGDCQLKLLVIKENDKVLASLFCGIHTRSILWIFKSKKAFIGATGIQEVDSICIEKNNILFTKKDDLFQLDINDVLFFLGVECLSVPGIKDSSWNMFSKMLGVDKKRSIIRAVPTYYVNLSAIQSVNGDYLSILSANKRSQINRSLKFYGGRESVYIEKPSSLDEALEMFDDLFILHSEQWKKKEIPSSFANTTAKQFHHYLILSAWEAGEIGLYKIRNNKCVIGYLYGFISHGTFLFYQSAFMYEEDNKIKSGLLCHLLLIEYLIDRGFRSYDFLAGDSQYKKSLSTDSYMMNWIDIYKYDWHCFLVKKIRYCKRRVSSLLDSIFTLLSLKRN